MTTVHPEKAGRYSPSELVISIQQKKTVVDKNPLIYARQAAQEVKTTPPEALIAERIIKYVIFSAVTMPTNRPACVTGKAGIPDS